MSATALTAADFEREVQRDIAGFYTSPLRFAKYAYPWGEGELGESAGPREWQAAVLAHITGHLSAAETRFTPCQVAVSSGHGIGKSALIAMITHWAMSTCDDCKVVITANTGTQLATKTAPEVGKWFRAGINAHWFDVKATSVTSLAPGHERLWRADFIPWSEHNTEAFAGLHNAGKRIVLIFDEASGIADSVWQVAEGALTDERTEIIWLAFGNPTQNTGRFRECFGSLKHRWKTMQIDSRSVEGTNKQQIAKWIEDYGEDSDFVRVRVRGEFPRASFNQFIAGEDVSKCRRFVNPSTVGPKILAVDVARFGDDQTVIGVRQGRQFRILAKLRTLDTAQVGFRVIEFIQQEAPDAIVVDADGLGAGTVDHLRYRGFTDRLFEFHGGERAQNPHAYFNRRAEMWGAMRDWLRAGAQIPDDPELEADLTGVMYGCANSSEAVQLERKEHMKARGLASPDSADCLAMTFAVQVQEGPPPEKQRQWEPQAMETSWMG